MSRPDPVYLDYNATAPIRPEAQDAAVCALRLGANPSSVHAAGRVARAARPAPCTEDGLPPMASARAIASAASGRIGAVAL